MAAMRMNLREETRGRKATVPLFLAVVTLVILPPVLHALVPVLVAIAEMLLELGQAGVTFLRSGGFS